MSTLGFWGRLSRPIMALAPLEDVTDAAFRFVIAKYGKPDVMFTEFTSADGLCSPGQKRLLENLQYHESERPIVAQIFGANPKNIEKSARLIRELEFDGIDINMGCPEKNIVKSGACSALIQTPKLAQEIIHAAKAGAGKLPVSIKTRIGYNTNQVEDWIPALLSVEPACVTVHGRTRKEMSKVPADWNAIARAVELRDQAGVRTLILGNGDVADVADAYERAQKYGVDGVMLGRAIFGNPWLFGRRASGNERAKQESFNTKKQCVLEPVSRGEKLHVLLEHTELFEKYFGRTKNFAIMKKHFKAYISGWDGAKQLRARLMLANDAAEVREMIKKFLKQNSF